MRTASSELKAVEVLHSFSKAQLFSYMKLLDIPIGLLINFHEPVLKNGVSRMILPGANQAEGNEPNEVFLYGPGAVSGMIYWIHVVCYDRNRTARRPSCR
jgi:PD-(D/E)XK nuclease superfamily